MNGSLSEVLGYDSNCWTYGYTDTSRGQPSWTSLETLCANAKLETGKVRFSHCFGIKT